MTNSRNKKKRMREFKNWRINNNVHVCQRCGEKLSKEVHHYLCNKCHRIYRRELLKRSDLSIIRGGVKLVTDYGRNTQIRE